MSLSEKDEPALGEAVAIQATNRYPIYPDENLNKYVTLVGRTVGASSATAESEILFCRSRHRSGQRILRAARLRLHHPRRRWHR